MKAPGFSLAIQAVCVSVFAGGAALAADLGPGYHGRQNLRAKAAYCTDCHGHSGQGYRGYYAIPRIAGQTSEYLENQLLAFRERRRDSDMPLKMAKVHGLSTAVSVALANHFEEVHARPIGGAPRGQIEQGKKIFEEGIPDANVPACSACHGPEAMGDGQNPRLAGQLYPYTVKELINWRRGSSQNASGEDTSAVMAPIAQSLNRQQIEAVAAYLSFLK